MRRTSLTGRAALLALVLGVLVVLLAYPLRQYVEHRARVAALQAENEQRRETVEHLRHQVDRWRDPAYVRAQARERLHFVMPGETGYLTLPDGGEPGADRDLERLRASLPDDAPWYGRLWSSVQAASRATGSATGSDSRDGHPRGSR